MEEQVDLDKLKDAAADAVDKAKDAASDAADSAKDAAAGIGEKLGGITDSFKK